MELDHFQSTNRANWDDRVPVHVASDDYGVPRFIDDPSHLSAVVAFDAPLIGDISGVKLAHLQCHIGTDSISLARLGASVTGVDFSEPALVEARRLATTTGDDVRFVLANIYDAAAACGDDFDFVYTSVGTIMWLGDIELWAAAVAGLLKPGGRFYIRDLHPFMYVFDEADGVVSPTYDYWTDRANPEASDEGAFTYTDGDASGITHTQTYDWSHTMAEILNALIGAGLRIDRMEEQQGLDWKFLDSAVFEDPHWFLPGSLRQKIPASFSLWATKS